MSELDYEIIRTILNDLEDERGLVRVKLKDGTEVIGRTDIIVWEDADPDDDDNTEEYELLRFIPDGQSAARYFREDEVESYEVISE